MAKSLEQLVRENIDNIREWRVAGFSTRQIASKLGVKVNTIYLYLRIIPELADAWEYANTKLVKEVLEPAIIKQALEGMSYIEKHEELKEGKMQVTKQIHKRVYSPHVLQFVLKTLDPGKWGASAQKDEQKIGLAEELDELGI